MRDEGEGDAISHSRPALAMNAFGPVDGQPIHNSFSDYIYRRPGSHQIARMKAWIGLDWVGRNNQAASKPIRWIDNFGGTTFPAATPSDCRRPNCQLP
jgi:hypothetical protein